jgi:hypothetical protein
MSYKLYVCIRSVYELILNMLRLFPLSLIFIGVSYTLLAFRDLKLVPLGLVSQ